MSRVQLLLDTTSRKAEIRVCSVVAPFIKSTVKLEKNKSQKRLTSPKAHSLSRIESESTSSFSTFRNRRSTHFQPSRGGKNVVSTTARCPSAFVSLFCKNLLFILIYRFIVLFTCIFTISKRKSRDVNFLINSFIFPLIRHRRIKSSRLQFVDLSHLTPVR